MTRICKDYPCFLQYKMKRGLPVRQPTIAYCLFNVSSCLLHRDTHIKECEDDPLRESSANPTYTASATKHVRIVLRDISLPPHKFKKNGQGHQRPASAIAKGISGLHPR